MGVRWFGLLQELELTAFDHLMRLRPSEVEDSKLLIVKVTEKDVSDDGGYPLGDATLVKLIDRLQQYRPKVIGVDMHRGYPRKQGRQELIKRFQKNKNLFTVCSFGNSRDGKDYNPPKEFSKEQLTNQVGFSDFPEDRKPDNNGRFVRRQLLSYDSTSYPSSSSSPFCITPYSFSLQLAYQYLQEKKIKPLTITKNEDWQFGQTIFKKLAVRTGGYQHLDGKSSQILLNYRSGELAPTVTLGKVLNEPLNKYLVEDRVVIIGYANENSIDTDSPFDTPYGRMPAVFIHAHMVSQILNSVIDKPPRPLLWVLPQWRDIQWGDAVLVFGCSVTGGVLALCFRQPLRAFFAGGVATLVWHEVCLFLVIKGGWMPFLPSTLSLWLTGFCIFVVIRFQHQ